jgi:hypothetical protein
MNRPLYRPPPPSRASASTLCQKCLKKDKSASPFQRTRSDLHPRHFSYECKAPAQERPYQARPSRTQQLMNPKLAPKLTSDVPEDFLNRYAIPLRATLLFHSDQTAGKASRTKSLPKTKPNAAASVPLKPRADHARPAPYPLTPPPPSRQSPPPIPAQFPHQTTTS